MIGIHGGLAMISGRSEWALDTAAKVYDGKTEAEFYAQSTADVARHYGGDLLDQKTVDWLNLIQCLALVYGSRIVAIRMSPRAKPKPKPPTVQEAARDFGGHGPSSIKMSDNPGQVDIPGLGAVDIPEDSPLHPNYKPPLN